MQKLCSLFALVLCAVAANSQNVGIGTTTPTEKLQVTGNIKADTVKPNIIKITSNAGTGKVLTSDAVGNATWQASAASASSNAPATAGFGTWGDCSANGISEYLPIGDTAGVVNDFFGTDPSISGNFAVIGAPQVASVGKGYANVYQFDGTNWVFMQRLTDPAGVAGDAFGVSTAISGNFIVIGSLLDSVGQNPQQGSAVIFQFNGTTWAFKQKVVDPSGTAFDFFGVRVAISGNNLLVSASQDDVGAQSNQGSVVTFRFNGSTWIFGQKLTDPAGAGGDGYGTGLSISGNFAVVGAPFATQGDGNVILYQLTGTNWVAVKKIIDSSGVALGNRFGSSVSISGNYLAIGEPDDRPHGSANIYFLNGTNLNFIQKFRREVGGDQVTFGSSVSISGNYLIIGDVLNFADFKGSATIYSRVGAFFQKLQFVTDPAGQPNDQLGGNVVIDSNTKRFILRAGGYANGRGKIIFGKVN